MGEAFSKHGAAEEEEGEARASEGVRCQGQDQRHGEGADANERREQEARGASSCRGGGPGREERLRSGRRKRGEACEIFRGRHARERQATRASAWRHYEGELQPAELLCHGRERAPRLRE